MTDVRPCLTARELAERHRVNPKTPSRWVGEGRMGAEGVAWFRTPGGQLRFWLDKIEQMEREGWQP